MLSQRLQPKGGPQEVKGHSKFRIFQQSETFSGSFIGVSGINMEIYNRWGELIFESDDINFDDDSKSLDPDTILPPKWIKTYKLL